MNNKVITELQEIQKLNREIAKLSQDLKKLRTRKIANETSVRDYLISSGTECVQYQDIKVTLKERPVRAPKSRDIRDANGIDVLVQQGISNPQEVLAGVKEAMRGDIVTKSVIQIREKSKK